MAPSIEFVAAIGGHNCPQREPGRVEQRALVTFVIQSGKCTAHAKTLFAKSSTYEAKFDLLCKSLQGNVPYYWHSRVVGDQKRMATKHRKILKIKEKSGYNPTFAALGLSYPMAHQLH
ncbi:MAG TPA: hypothetical protein VH724_02885 [Candidatus Angelobacter sp.]|nr:hypothetical protein [Candidatus Angelobacter sp.]